MVENAFGILANRFQCLMTSLKQSTKTIKSIVMACVVLHNFMRLRCPGPQNRMLDVEGPDGDVTPGAWRQGFNWTEVDNMTGGNRDYKAAKKQRLTLLKYFNSEVGMVPWQDRMI